MNVKKIIIEGDEKELEFICRTLCGVLNLTTVAYYNNCKDKGLMVLDTRVGDKITAKTESKDGGKDGKGN